MTTETEIREKAHARRAIHAWKEGQDVELSAGPHLFLDWRFVLSGQPRQNWKVDDDALQFMGPYWTTRDRDPVSLKCWQFDNDAWKDREIQA